jgi:tetratricopeptide (TPR) repeat protein
VGGCRGGPLEIDTYNIHQASLRAMRRAVMALVPLPDLVLVDAFRIPGLLMAQRGVAHGDARCSAIAAASIVAKVHRDRLMQQVHAEDPRYGFDRHKGYATAEHLAAVARFGYSPVHRRTFRPPSLFDTVARGRRADPSPSPEPAVAIDREDTLKRAEKLLRQGRLDAAIAEYQRVVEAYPADWHTANALGDLFQRAQQFDKAIAQYLRIADHFAREGFLPRASAVYRKALRLEPRHEHALLQLAEVAVRQGILVEARECLSTVADVRAARGDASGAAEIAFASLPSTQTTSTPGSTPRARRSRRAWGRGACGAAALASAYDERGEHDRAARGARCAVRARAGRPGGGLGWCARTWPPGHRDRGARVPRRGGRDRRSRPAARGGHAARRSRAARRRTGRVRALARA